MDFKKPKKGKPIEKEVEDSIEEKGLVSTTLEVNTKHLETIFEDTMDFILRPMAMGARGELKMAVGYLETMTDNISISNYFLEKLSTYNYNVPEKAEEKFKDLGKILESIPAALDIEESDKWDDVLEGIVEGKAAFFLEGYNKAWIVEARMWQERAVAEPQVEAVVQGPREGFVEGLQTNVSLIRRRLRTQDLMTKPITVGTTANTNIVICYLKGVADEKLVEEVEKRIQKVSIEGVISGNVINEMIEDTPMTPFKTIATTERPDKVAASLLEGRVGIITENTPLAMIVPSVFWQFFQSSEDYYERFPIATFNRVMRMFSFVLVLALTAFYVAIATYHQEMIPTQLAITMSSIREPVPFPTVVEALLLEGILEALREAGLRLPSAAGQAVGIVGALVMGQAAVEAGLVSPQMVIIVAAAGVSSFLIPDFSFVISLRLLKFLLILLASIFGIFGLVMGLIGIMLHLNALQSFNVPFMSPVTPFKLRDMKDIFVRAPWFAMGKKGPSSDDDQQSEVKDSNEEDNEQYGGEENDEDADK
ncbi:spore germination protein [Proteinivorax hydrogeniformans]|uniref:Spore germination protein n=1 Tax=Proteinivorax hydrogeniformans TaxID=1826727 RepID=A0AAU8HW48_9FIRM